MENNRHLEAMDIVDSVKSYRSFFQKFYKFKSINFLGCSEYYVREKIDALIFELQQMKRHLRQVEKEQIALAKMVEPKK